MMAGKSLGFVIIIIIIIIIIVCFCSIFCFIPLYARELLRKSTVHIEIY